MRFFLLLFISVTSVCSKLLFNEDGSFKILHISDVHYEIPSFAPNTCQGISHAQLPCDQSNSTAFLSWLIEIERPNLIVHTGDVVDWATAPASQGMTEFYGISYKYNIPWAASLGNHDDDSWTMTNREKVMNYILDLPGTLSAMGPVSSSYGNFVLEIFSSDNATVPDFRTYHFDSDTQGHSISSDQVTWFESTSKTLNDIIYTPSLAFYHVPLEEYQFAINSGTSFSGSYNEAICYEPTNTGIFDALKSNGVKAGFCGHDHTNDFCINYEDVKLCYEGSPGFQAYGLEGYPRKARVTELRAYGNEIVSWKRLDTSIGGGAVQDMEYLWSSSSLSGNVKKDDNMVQYHSVTKVYVASLPTRSQPKPQ